MEGGEEVTRKRHKETAVKVTAYVDVGVAPLVEALNTIETIVTFESCEGYGKDLPVVWFRTHPEEALVDTVAWLGSWLASTHKAEYRLSISWRGGPDIHHTPRSYMRLPTAMIQTTKQDVGALAEEIRKAEKGA